MGRMGEVAVHISASPARLAPSTMQFRKSASRPIVHCINARVRWTFKQAISRAMRAVSTDDSLLACSSTEVLTETDPI